jgi:GT2 family glycosyltransferase
MKKLVIQLVTWNGAKYIPHLFDSLRKQTFRDFHLSILDNGSTDGTEELIRKELQNFQFQYSFEQNEKNVGFAGGHNHVYKKITSKEYGVSECEYILLLNQDMYLTPGCIQKMVTFLNTHESVAAVSPRLMRWDFSLIEKGLEYTFTHVIDALGLRVFRNRRVIEKYAAKVWEDKKSKVELSYRTHNDAMEVFGVSGAFPMYRCSALQVVRFSDGTFLDELYQSYKEDVDLAYRLRIAGFGAYVLLDSVAYHDRSAAGLERVGDRISAKNKKNQSEWVKFHSYKNHLATLYKNEYWQNVILDFPWIMWYELKKFVYFILFDRAVLSGLSVFWKQRIEFKIRRGEVKKMRKISWKELRQWLH